MKKHCATFLLSFFLFFFNHSNAQFVIDDNTHFSYQSLHQNTLIVDVKQHNLTISEVLKLSDSKFEPLLQENTDLGFTDDNYWLKFQIKNTRNEEVEYFLETSRPIIDFATLYEIDSNGKILIKKSGDNIPFNERSFKHRKTIFKIKLAAHESKNYYIHLKSDGEVINAPVLLRTAENLIEITSFEQIIFGFFYGILLIASILYFFFFYAIRQKVFLFYSFYVVFIGLLQFSLDGYFYEFIMPSAGWFSNKAVLIFAVISGFFLGNYAQHFLKVKSFNKTLYFAFNTLYALFGLLFCVILFIPNFFKYCYPAMNALGLLLLLLIVASTIEVYHKKKQFYLFFSLGIFSLIMGFVIFILKNFSILPYNFITENSSKLGTGVEVIFLSLSMASLIKKLKDDKETMQDIALEKSQEMNEMKSYFLSNVSHELRTPLNTIVNFIESINSETDSKTIQEKCEVIRSSSSSLLSSVNDLLDFSKIEKGDIKLEIAEFDIHRLLNEVNTNLTIRANDKNISFQYIPASNLPKMVVGDANRIRQIIMNLLYNAVKFTNEGIVKFKVECVEIDNKIDLTFIISDSGSGIAKEKMNSIFDSFSQESINNKRKYGGLGLGLYIVRALVKLHDGKIEMDSIVNQGTVCNVNVAVEKSQTIEKTVEELVVDYDLKGKHILVVEDNAMNQMVIKMITKKWENTTLDYAINGQECLDLMSKTKYDIILMDLQMPVMDGYEATIAIRSGNCGINNKFIPIIAVTADVMETTKERVKDIGMDFYLSKPVNKELLFSTIKYFA